MAEVKLPYFTYRVLNGKSTELGVIVFPTNGIVLSGEKGEGSVIITKF